MIVLLCLQAWIHVTVMFRNSWRGQCRGSGSFMLWVVPLHGLYHLVWTFMVETYRWMRECLLSFHQYVQYVVIVLIWLSSDEWCVNVWVLVMKMFIFIYDGLAVSTRVVSQTILVNLDGFTSLTDAILRCLSPPSVYIGSKDSSDRRWLSLMKHVVVADIRFAYAQQRMQQQKNG